MTSVRHGVLAVMLFAFTAADVRAQSPVVTDGSFGKAARALRPGGDGVIHVEPSRGKQAGGNLFHSFSRLSVPRGTTVQIDAPADGAPAVGRVFARVTGGAATRIDGTLVSATVGADFYLINPSGIVVGPRGQVRAEAGVHLTTADTVTFADRAVFAAAPAAGETLSAAPPAAFGFLGKPAGVSFVNGKVETSLPRTFPLTAYPISVVAGDISLSGTSPALADRSQLIALGAQLDLISLGGAGTVDLREARAPRLRSGTPRGRIDVSDSSVGAGTFTTGEDGFQQAPSRDGPIRVSIVAHDLTLRRSGIAAEDGGNANVPAMRIDLTGTLDVAETAQVAARRSFDGPAGALEMVARDVRVVGVAPTPAFTGIVAARGAGTGEGAPLRITAERLSLSNGGEVATTTLSAGRAAPVEINADEISVDGLPSGIRASTRPDSSGNGGDATIRARSLTLTRGGQVEVSTSGSGDGGNVSIFADTITIDSNANLFTGIAADINAGSTARRGGNVRLGSAARPVRELSVRRGGGIGARSFSGGEAGSIVVHADAINIDGRGTLAADATTGINVNARAASANGGDIELNVGRLDVTGGDVNATAGGDGGNVSIVGQRRVVFFDSVLQAAAGGDGGRITLTADNVALNRSTIDGRTRGGTPVAVSVGLQSNFLRSTDSEILAERAPILPPDADVASGLVTINTGTLGGAESLLPNCADQAIGEGSSFSVAPAGGLVEEN